jgi:hypothetical protein
MIRDWWRTGSGRRPGLTTLKWGAFARERLMTNRRLEIVMPDLHELLSQLGRIGSNVNQIAHRVNIRQRAEYDELTEVRRLLEKADGILKRIELATTPKTVSEDGEPWRW